MVARTKMHVASHVYGMRDVLTTLRARVELLHARADRSEERQTPGAAHVAPQSTWCTPTRTAPFIRSEKLERRVGTRMEGHSSKKVTLCAVKAGSQRWLILKP